MSSRSRTEPSPEAGFSLIELMIVTVILLFISFAIYQATSSTFQLRESLLSEGDFYSGIRQALEILNRDVALLYTPQIGTAGGGTQGTAGIQPGQPQGAVPQALAGDLSQVFTYWEPASDATGIRPSRFIGETSKMSFIAASHIRIYKDAPESLLAKISYETVRDENPDTYVLTKTESPNVFETDDKRDKLSRTYKLLHGITKIAYRYYRKDKEEWIKSWDTDKEDTKNIYPDIVEVTVDIAGPDHLNFEGKYEFRPELPINGLYPSN